MNVQILHGLQHLQSPWTKQDQCDSHQTQRSCKNSIYAMKCILIDLHIKEQVQLLTKKQCLEFKPGPSRYMRSATMYSDMYKLTHTINQAAFCFQHSFTKISSSALCSRLKQGLIHMEECKLRMSVSVWVISEDPDISMREVISAWSTWTSNSCCLHFATWTSVLCILTLGGNAFTWLVLALSLSRHTAE